MDFKDFNLKIEKKIISNILLIPLVGLLTGVVIGYFFITYSSSLSQKKGEEFLKQREIQLQKDRLKLLVNSVIDDIELAQTFHQPYLKLIKQLYSKYKNKYVFIYKVHNLNGGDRFATMILNSNRPDLIGKLISDNYTDIKGFAFRKEMLRLIRKHGEAFVQYYYKKPNSNQILPKISYFKYYKPLSLIIASGVYLDDIDHIVC